MTTIETLTDEQISALRDAAVRKGDYPLVAICTRAISEVKTYNLTDAIAECVRVLNEPPG